MNGADSSPLQRYLAVRRPIEVGVWSLFFAAQAVANMVTTGMDFGRRGLRFSWWQVATWEVSSNLVALMLVPLLLLVLDRRPLHWGVLAKNLPFHGLAALAFSLLHVAGMVVIRKALYAALGQHYDFGDWRAELFYEAVKDFRTYLLVVCVALAYRLLLWRWQGEARLLAAPDETGVAPVAEAATADPLERPERFLVRKLGKEFLLPTAEIEWVQACGNYVNLHRRGHDYPLRATLAAIELRLDPARFVRVHRSWLVNLAMVEAIEPIESGDARIRMTDGSAVPCSRTHLGSLRQRAG